jgi:signal peptidase
MKTLLNIGYYLLIAVICGLGLLVLVSLMPIQGNFAVKVVKSGSMEPTIHVGSVVVDKPEAVYNVGDIVTFGSDTKTQVPTTHRIVGITGIGANEMITTKGDANNGPDENQTPIGAVHGKVIFTIPYLGYILAFAKTKLGFILLVAFPALLICIEEIYKIFQEVRSLRRSKNAKLAVRTSTHPFDLALAKRVETQDTNGYVMDLRNVSPKQTMVSRVRTAGESRTGQAIVAVFGILFVISMTSFSRTSGDTTAYYINSQVSEGNILRRGTSSSTPITNSPFIFAGAQGVFIGASDTSDNTGDTGTSTPDISGSDASSTPPTDASSTPDVSTATDTPPTDTTIGTTSTGTPPVDPPAVVPPPADPPTSDASTSSS